MTPAQGGSLESKLILEASDAIYRPSYLPDKVCPLYE